MDAVAAGKAGAVVDVPENFPVGLRVMVVDDDTVWLKIIQQMLRKCSYHVTICSQATAALDLLREKRDCYDIVLSDVHMPDMDGLKLLEHIGLEMDLPVIMMSADDRTSLVMRGVQHGACDYLIKPIRHEELTNIWQHVIRKKCNLNKENDHSSSFEDNAEHASSTIDGGASKATKKKRESKEEDDPEMESDDTAAAKKPRVVWSVELHQQFVSAVNQLGIDKAVPKRILELMNIPGLTRENVASHLQKFRLYLKRLSGFAQQGGLLNSMGSLGRYEYDIQALIPPQTLAALHAELLGQQQQPTGVSFGHHPLINCPPKIFSSADSLSPFANDENSNIWQVVDQGLTKSLGCAGRGPSIPSLFAVDESELSVSDLHGYNENSTYIGGQMIQRVSRNDFMGVLH